jgi:hypothetical protein
MLKSDRVSKELRQMLRGGYTCKSKIDCNLPFKPTPGDPAKSTKQVKPAAKRDSFGKSVKQPIREDSECSEKENRHPNRVDKSARSNSLKESFETYAKGRQTHMKTKEEIFKKGLPFQMRKQSDHSFQGSLVSKPGADNSFLLQLNNSFQSCKNSHGSRMSGESDKEEVQKRIQFFTSEKTKEDTKWREKYKQMALQIEPRNSCPYIDSGATGSEGNRKTFEFESSTSSKPRPERNSTGLEDEPSFNERSLEGAHERNGDRFKKGKVEYNGEIISITIETPRENHRVLKPSKLNQDSNGFGHNQQKDASKQHQRHDEDLVLLSNDEMISPFLERRRENPTDENKMLEREMMMDGEESSANKGEVLAYTSGKSQKSYNMSSFQNLMDKYYDDNENFSILNSGRKSNHFSESPPNRELIPPKSFPALIPKPSMQAKSRNGADELRTGLKASQNPIRENNAALQKQVQWNKEKLQTVPEWIDLENSISLESLRKSQSRGPRGSAESERNSFFHQIEDLAQRIESGCQKLQKGYGKKVVRDAPGRKGFQCMEGVRDEKVLKQIIKDLELENKEKDADIFEMSIQLRDLAHLSRQLVRTLKQDV